MRERMRMEEKKLKGTGSAKMGEMPMHKLFLSMSVPLIVSMLVQALYNIVDSIFVSWICEDALTAVSLVAPIQNLMIAVASGTGVGVNALISRKLGQNRADEANAVANNGIFLAICSYVVFLIVGLTCSRPFMLLQTDIESIVDYGTTYMTIVMALSIGMFGQMTIERLLQATGNTVFPMITQMSGAIINIIFDWLLIFGVGPFPELGVAGAAYATIFGQCVALVMGVIFNAKYNKEIRLSVRMMRPQGALIKEIYKIGIPSIIMVSIGSVMTFGMNKILMGFTSTATAVFGAYFKLQGMVFMPLFGMNSAVVPIVGYNYGAGNKKRIRQVYKIGCIYGCIFMWVGFAAFQLIPKQLLTFFNASENMMDIGVQALRIASLIFIFAGISVVSGGVFQGAGKSMYSMIVSFIRQLIVLLPAAFILSRFGNLTLVWFAIPLSEFVGFAVTLILMRKLMKNLDAMMAGLK